jgi:ribose-phosphate pyrophosphokinase
MIVFPLPGFRGLLPAGLRAGSEPSLGGCAIQRFPDRELWLELDRDVEGRECAVLGSLAPPDEQALLVLLMAHTLKRAGARRVVGLLPYLGYGRQDRAGPRQSLGAAWAGELLAAAGVDEVVTVDIHSPAAAACFPIPVASLSPAPLFAAELRRSGVHGLCVVAPDEGAVGRCRDVARAAGVRAPVAWLRKQRTPGGVVHRELVGKVQRRAALVDDILDTGGTLLSACAELRRAGVEEIRVMATHGTFSGERWRTLASAGVRRIQVTDTLPDVRARAGGRAEVLAISSLLMEALERGLAAAAIRP